LLLAASACQSGSEQITEQNLATQPRDTTPPPDVIFRTDSSNTLFTAELSEFQDSAFLVIRDRRSWHQAWYRVFSVQNPRPVPEVDFDWESVLLASRGTGYYWIRIDSLGTLASGGHVIFVSTTTVGPRCPPPPPVLLHPVHAVRVPAIVEAVAWRGEAKSMRC
jgi:hypothetical protein